jgi:hypothetical protein
MTPRWRAGLASRQAHNLQRRAQVAQHQLRELVQIDGELVQPQFHLQQRLGQGRNIGEVIQSIERKLWYLSQAVAARWNSENAGVRHGSSPGTPIGIPGRGFQS